MNVPQEERNAQNSALLSLHSQMNNKLDHQYGNDHQKPYQSYDNTSNLFPVMTNPYESMQSQYQPSQYSSSPYPNVNGYGYAHQPYMRDNSQLLPQHNNMQSNNSKIFVGALSPETDENDLLKLFSNCGQIREVKIIRSSSGESKCYGFVYFSSDEAAQFAQESYQGTVLNGRACDIKIGNNEVCLYISGIKRDWTQEQCESKLKSILPNVTRVSFPEDTRQSGINRGFVYVYLSSKSVAQKVIIALQRGDYIIDGVMLNGNWPDVSNDGNDLESINKYAVHLSNLPPGTQESEIRQIFAKYGDIDKITMSRDITSGQKDDYAFVNYVHPGPAEKAIEANYDLVIRGTKVEVNYNKRNDLKNKLRKNNTQPQQIANPSYQHSQYNQNYSMNYQVSNQTYATPIIPNSQLPQSQEQLQPNTQLVQNDDNQQKPPNYKSQLCRHYKSTSTCPKGASCQYAHGESELRPISRGHGGPSHSALGCPVFSPYLSAAYNVPKTYTNPSTYAQYYASTNMYQYGSSTAASTQSSYAYPIASSLPTPTYQYPYQYAYVQPTSYNINNTYYPPNYNNSIDHQSDQS